MPSLDQRSTEPRGAAPPEAVIRADGLRKVYRDGTVAVDRLDLSVHRGEVLALLGPNGAGKSTTAGMLTTGVVPTSGHAWVAGTDVVAHPAAARRDIGIVPQVNTLDRSLTVRENLVFHGRFFGMRAADARRAADVQLERVALTHVAAKPVITLSGGMAQRLMIARAILHRPAALFLDEPTTGLDPQSRIALHEIVRELRAAGQTIMLITHDMDEADELADRVAIVDHGRLLALGRPAELKRSVDADVVVTVAADAEPVTLAALLTDEVPGVRGAQPLDDTVLLTVRGGRAVFPEIAAAITRAGLTLRDLHVDEPTLETVFIHLTGKELRD
jgi:ABC-2 type transport system ATP-binding protein